MTTPEQRDAVRLDYGLSKYASLADAMDGAIREVAALRAAHDELVAALQAYVKYDEYINGPEGDSSTDRLQAARAALTKAAPEQQESGNV